MWENFTASANAILPLMLCIGIGYLARQALRIGDDAFYSRCNKFCFDVFMPVMMFTNIYEAEIASAFQPKLLIFSLGAIFLVAVAAFWVARRITLDPHRRAVLTQGIFRSNYVIFGIPVAANLYGEGNIAAAALLSAVAVPFFNVLAVITLEYYSNRKTGIKPLLFGVAKNPLILGAVAALLAKALPFELPYFLTKSAADLGDAATPMALVILGASLQFSSFRRNARELAWGVLGKTVIVPLICIPAAVLLGFRDVALLSLTILFASPTAVSSFTMAEAAGHDGPLAAQQVVLSSVVSLGTVFLWIFALRSFGLL